MSLELRPLADTDIAALQQLYEARPAAFRILIGRPALPDQAATDYVQGLLHPGRYQFAVTYESRLIGFADVKLAEEESRADLGLILLADPFDQPDVKALVLRILERWLAQAYGVARIEVGVPAHDPAGLLFWQAQGYRFTGTHYRRDLPGYAPRFLVMSRELTNEAPST